MLEEKTIKDLLELQKVFPERTFFFNHFGGNSLDHFHIHMTTEKLPIENVIYTTNKTKVSSIQNVNAQIFTINECQQGILLSGQQKELNSVIKEVMDKITHAGYSFNFILLPVKDNEQHIIFFIRKMRPSGTPIAGFIPDFSAQHSSLSLAGLFIIDIPVSFAKSNKSQDPYLDLHALDDASVQNCKETVIAPTKIFN